MKKAMIKKVTAFLIAGTMLIIVVPSHNKVTAEAKVNSINYDFLNNEPGMASGKITISTTTPGDYQLYCPCRSYGQGLRLARILIKKEYRRKGVALRAAPFCFSASPFCY